MVDKGFVAIMEGAPDPITNEVLASMDDEGKLPIEDNMETPLVVEEEIPLVGEVMVATVDGAEAPRMDETCWIVEEAFGFK